MIYFIEAVGADRVKIGFTESDPEARRKTLQTGCPHQLRVVCSIRGTQEDERELHGVFGHLRENGEWFRKEGELRLLLWLVPRVFGAQDRIASQAQQVQRQAESWFRAAYQRIDVHANILFPDDAELDEYQTPMCVISTMRRQIENLEDESHRQDVRIARAERSGGRDDGLGIALANEVVALKAKVFGRGVDDARRVGGDCRM